jgi:DNA-directed RNA polymerase specialized sigma24 family protein
MDRYAGGDDRAFSDLYDALAPRLHAFLLRQTRDRALAEDLMQQTFLQMHAARRHFTPGAEAMPWAFAMAIRLLIDRARRGGRELLGREAAHPALDGSSSRPDGCPSGPRWLARMPDASSSDDGSERDRCSKDLWAMWRCRSLHNGEVPPSPDTRGGKTSGRLAHVIPHTWASVLLLVPPSRDH